MRAVLADRALGDGRRGTRGPLRSLRRGSGGAGRVVRRSLELAVIAAIAALDQVTKFLVHARAAAARHDRRDSGAAEPHARAQLGRRVRVPQLGGLRVQAGGDGRLRARGARRRRALRRAAAAGSSLGTRRVSRSSSAARRAISSTARDRATSWISWTPTGAAGTSGRSTWPMPRSRSASPC